MPNKNNSSEDKKEKNIDLSTYFKKEQKPQDAQKEESQSLSGEKFVRPNDSKILKWVVIHTPLKRNQAYYILVGGLVFITIVSVVSFIWFYTGGTQTSSENYSPPAEFKEFEEAGP